MHNNYTIWKTCHDLLANRIGCDQYYFKLSSKYYKFNNNLYTICIFAHNYPTVIYELSLKMSFEEYMSLTASIISLWFGFSIIALTDETRDMFIKYVFVNTFIAQIINKLFINCNKYYIICLRQGRIMKIKLIRITDTYNKITTKINKTRYLKILIVSIKIGFIFLT